MDPALVDGSYVLISTAVQGAFIGRVEAGINKPLANGFVRVSIAGYHNTVGNEFLVRKRFLSPLRDRLGPLLYSLLEDSK